MNWLNEIEDQSSLPALLLGATIAVLLPAFSLEQLVADMKLLGTSVC
jgi:hypothetical protein